jgi:hypothetical protein
MWYVALGMTYVTGGVGANAIVTYICFIEATDLTFQYFEERRTKRENSGAIAASTSVRRPIREVRRRPLGATSTQCLNSCERHAGLLANCQRKPCEQHDEGQPGLGSDHSGTGNDA